MKKKQDIAPLTETALLILLAMYKPNHGYGVMQFVEKKTKGRVVFGPGTLYGAINNLHKKGWISPFRMDNGDRKKEYMITDEGKIQVESELNRLKEVYEIGIDIVEEGGKVND
ncbi:PadR family transcriptional regulator [Paratissierella segnis]|jgi:DNA-binding PadR family transcriptional regulator|uniref:PadR family transcriptional regulator n=1 Tax=Paratissierella segnis TaxID=2763679 RepID=A0A926IDY8_9FIRM|nr:PadR family transcriptional regulator [Paratissierella segnis]MBC8586782.1 PadR family transcriptional regulator [Paratissierella segnis]